MFKTRFVNAKGINQLLSGLFNVYADEPNTPPDSNSAPTVQAQSLNYESLIAQARKEEKDKLYPQIKKLQDDNKEHIKTINALLLERGQLQSQLEKARQSANTSPKESKEYKELETQYNTLKGQYDDLQKNAPKEEDLRAKFEQEYKVKLYAEKKRMEVSSDKSVVGAFLDSITGSTEEEVDNAVKSAIEKTKNLKKELGISDESSNPSSNPTTETKDLGRSPTNIPPMRQQGKFDVNAIRNMDVNSEEYKELRKSLGLRPKKR